MADWKNLSKLLSLHDRISWLFSQENLDAMSKLNSIENTISTPVDIAETPDQIYIYMEVPGIEIENVSVYYKEGQIIIKGSKDSPQLSDDQKAIRIERFFGNIERRFSIKQPVDENSIKASLNDGILTITMDKKTTKRSIEITG